MSNPVEHALYMYYQYLSGFQGKLSLGTYRLLFCFCFMFTKTAPFTGTQAISPPVTREHCISVSKPTATDSKKQYIEGYLEFYFLNEAWIYWLF